MIDDKGNARLAKASIAFGRLYKNVWNRSGIKKRQRLRSTVLWFSPHCCMNING